MYVLNLPVDFVGADVNLVYALGLLKLGSCLLHHGGESVGAFTHHHCDLVPSTDTELILPHLLPLTVVI